MLKKSPNHSLRTDIYLRSPNVKEGRASFSIYVRVEGKNKILRLEALDNINQKFKSGILNFDQAKILVKELMKQQIKPAVKVLHNQANLKILESYWEQEYSSRDLIDSFSAKRRLIRAVEAVGLLSLYSASRVELQNYIDSQLSGNKQRAVISALNQVLKFAGRDFKLKKAREEFKSVPYLKLEEAETLFSRIEEPNIKLIYQVAFGTGLRLGEIFAIKPEMFKDKGLQINFQIDRQEKQRTTKNRKQRTVYIIPKFMEFVKQWADIPLSDRLAYRHIEFSKLTRKLTQDKHTFHDLRHSYAIYLVSRGGSLTLISQSIGDSLAVTEKYYSGFELTSESINLLDSQTR